MRFEMYQLVPMILLLELTAGNTYIDSFEPCNKEMVANIKNVRLYRSKDGKDAMYNADLQVKQKIDIKPARLTIDMQKCTSMNTSSCNPIPPINLQNACSLKHLPQLPLKNMFECMNPRPDCIFEQRTYKLRNCVLDASKFNIPGVSLNGYYWFINMIIFGRNKKYVCLKVIVHLD